MKIMVVLRRIFNGRKRHMRVKGRRREVYRDYLERRGGSVTSPRSVPVNSASITMYRRQSRQAERRDLSRADTSRAGGVEIPREM